MICNILLNTSVSMEYFILFFSQAASGWKIFVQEAFQAFLRKIFYQRKIVVVQEFFRFYVNTCVFSLHFFYVWQLSSSIVLK